MAEPDRAQQIKQVAGRLQHHVDLQGAQLRASLRDDRLLVLLEYARLPSQVVNDLCDAILKQLRQEPELKGVVASVVIIGRRSVEKQPEWQRGFPLNGSATPPPSSPATLVPSGGSVGSGGSGSVPSLDSSSSSHPSGPQPSAQAFDPAAPPRPPRWLGRLLVGRYRLIQVLAQGGYGRTFLAEDTLRPGSPICVVKQLSLPPHQNRNLDRAREFFKLEAETLEQLGRHSQIPQLLAYFEEEGQFYLTQELIEGHPLSRDLQNGPLDEDQVVALLLDVLRTLDFVHQYQVIHRDLKPDNLMRRHRDNSWVLIDFGAVKQLREDTTQDQGYVIGTLGYIPPEQWARDPRYNSDIYALGIVAVQCLTGLAPSELERDSPTSPLRWRDQAQVSQALADIIDRMIQPDTNQRYQSAPEVLAELERSCVDSDELLPPWQIILRRLKQPEFRRKLILGSIGSGIAIFGISFGWYQFQAYGARRDFYRGLQLVQLMEWQQAADLYQRATGRDPFLIPARLGWNQAQSKVETLQQQVEQNRSQLRENRNLLEPRIQLGVSLYQLGEGELAASELDAAILVAGDQAELDYHLGRAYAAEGQWQNAIRSYLRALERQSTFADARVHLGIARIQVEDLSGAIASLQIATELRQNDPEARYYLGQAYALSERWDQALESYRRALLLYPPYRKQQNDLGYALYQPGQMDRALRDYRNRFRSESTDATAAHQLGIAYKIAGQEQQAEEAFQRALSIDPNRLDTNVALGQLYQDLGRWTEAQPFYEAALQLNADWPEALAGLGMVLAERAVADTEAGSPEAAEFLQQAQAQLQRAVRIEPGDSLYHYHLGLIQAQQGNRSEAIRSLQQAVNLNPDHPDMRRHLADQLLLQGDIEAALQQVQAGLERDPGHSGLYLTWAGLLAGRGDTQQAIAQLQAAAILGNQEADSAPTPSNLDQAVADQSQAVVAEQVYVAVTASEPGQAQSEGTASIPEQQRQEILTSTNPAETLMDDVVESSPTGRTELQRLRSQASETLLAPKVDQWVQNLLWSIVIAVWLIILLLLGLGTYIWLDQKGWIPKKTHKQWLAGLARKRYQKGLALVDRRRWDAAIHEFRAATRLDPSLAGAYFQLGQLLAQKSDFEGAISQYWVVDGLDAQFEGLQEALTKALITYGNELLQAGKVDQAVLQYRQALPMADQGELTRTAELHYRLGLALSKQKDIQSVTWAVRELQVAVQLNPNHAHAYYTLGVVLGRSQEYDQALEAYEYALQLDGQIADARYQMGLILLWRGDLQSATQQFRSVMVLEPKLEVQISLGLALIEAGELQAAEQELRKVLKADPLSAQACLGLGKIRFEQGNMEQAEEFFHQAIDHDSSQASAKAMLGVIEIARKQQRLRGAALANPRTWEVVLNQFEAAIRDDFQVPEAHYGLGEISRVQGQYAFAINSYRNALQSNHSYTAAAFRLATVYAQVGNHQAAAESFEHTLRLNPRYPGAAEGLRASLAQSPHSAG